MIFEGFALGILTTTGWCMLFRQLPVSVQNWIIKHSLLTDFAALVTTYFLLGGGLTAMFASAVADILISAMLHIANHPQDFEWLFDALRMIRELFGKAQNQLKELNNNYKAHKTVPEAVVGI